MSTSRHFRTLWLAALAVLVFAQGLHVAEHWSVFHQASHFHHDHDHDCGHSHDSHPSEPGESHAEHSHRADHCHSPAIVDSHFLIRGCVAVLSSHTVTLTAPEAPVWEIDYPPQLT